MSYVKMEIKFDRDGLISSESVVEQALRSEIDDYRIAALRVDSRHWLSQYFEKRMLERISDWERLTGRKYVR